MDWPAKRAAVKAVLNEIVAESRDWGIEECFHQLRADSLGRAKR